ncbi:sigma-70 family RNA polymerase sigma factor [Streptomyces sp. BE20]|uniref:sigma-70 family RNA polymerase sigma factor n=1 Tax=Streptomyces sp. BE20 TaxID=3002525 RepID=UPI002E774852|nr:sigma-70 family RNA polymerase sigma factor [Streptomyces sp. BE20]MEE1823421.1 sigma-70 family RNA polymerase sigma factor [Streptomyces sp. BE20]
MNVDVQSRTGTTLVLAAQAGDPQAREALVAAWLPLVYNVAGRALNGHADVDDVAQETMIRALDGLDGLRDPEAFRSWLVAITMNQVRRRSTGQQQAAVGGLDETWELADPRADFTDLTILRLGLSGQRREVAEATRWLDPDDQELLALWWLEASGELTRAELAAALDLTPQHTAVRVQRMKKQLEAGRVVVRALTAYPRCPELAELTGGWDGAPDSVWRKRIARHIRACAACDGLGRDLFPAEGLLAGLALVPVPMDSPAGLALQAASAASAASAAPPAGSGGTGSGATAPGGSGAPPADPAGGHGGWAEFARRKTVLAGGTAAVLAAATLAMVWPHHPQPGETVPEPTTPAAAPDTPSTVSIPAPPEPRPETPSAVPSPTVTAAAEPAPVEPPVPSTPPATVTPSSSRSATPPPSPERQLVDLVNAERARIGCGPLRIDPKLHAAAQKHSEDMVARTFFDHVSPDGTRADSRLGAAGYRWSQWGENLDRGPSAPAVVFSRWMDGGIHQSNMLDCAFKDVGIGVAGGPAGLYWTQDLGAPLG